MVIVENSIRSSYQRNVKVPYVTAYIKADVLPWTFVIGDGREYNSEDKKYLNQPLKQNSKYIAFLRFYENEVNTHGYGFSNTIKDGYKRYKIICPQCKLLLIYFCL